MLGGKTFPDVRLYRGVNYQRTLKSFPYEEIPHSVTEEYFIDEAE
jgi:hypothetical protein